MRYPPDVKVRLMLMDIVKGLTERARGETPVRANTLLTLAEVMLEVLKSYDDDHTEVGS